MARTLVVQLARLGDLIQTIPAITALKMADQTRELDLLCPSSLAPIGRLIPGVDRVLEWDGAVWRRWAEEASADLLPAHVERATKRLEALARHRYGTAYVLNHHRRALLAGSLLADEVRGPLLDGPLGSTLSPWASYVRDVALTGRGCRVHLADAFCGLCGVPPPGRPPVLKKSSCQLPPTLDQIGRRGEPWIGLLVGAGAAERLVPTEIWKAWVVRFLEAAPTGRVVLLGEERERGQRIQDLLPSSLLGRVWDVTGRTSLLELVSVLGRCHAVIGSDTGPLHLAAAVGVKVFGWYFARARVHETGPYGAGHPVWQAVEEMEADNAERLDVRPAQWPIEASIAAMPEGKVKKTAGWSVWTSHYDQWGAYYTEVGGRFGPPSERERLWRELSPSITDGSAVGAA
ncbi:MAG: glycosyltransferase family 9 protein [Nitrospira sp.]|nr:glycosyltransferase family 9 protein [Nitrospira sp.]MCP9462292.1 glycosyltransferase family 9 protein [Nitrospira sp.]MCP9474875.1 glycosyltransferase family 9 protein [Nitrospira sp.]